MRSSAACWAAYGEVLARSFQDPDRREVHQLAVDAFAVQHPGDPGRREAQSVAIHLMTLCMVIEEGLDPCRGPALHKQMVHRPVFHRLKPPTDRGEVTAADVASAGDADAHVERVRQWADSAWRAWQDHHETVRQWLSYSRSDLERPPT